MALFWELAHLWYRLCTVLHSIWVLYTLPASKVQAFFDAYTIWDWDWSDDAIGSTSNKKTEDYAVVKKKLVDYYSVLNYLCALGQVEKMYIPAVIDPRASIFENQVLFERRMAQDLAVGPSKRVLDIGCGRGRIAAHVANYTGAHVTGINIDEGQLASANQFASRNGLDKQTRFQLGDVNDLPYPFADGSFDGVYQVQVFSYSRDLVKAFKDIHRVLRPGGTFVALDYVLKDAFNPKDPHHVDLLRRSKPLLGAIGSRTAGQYAGALKEAGFDVLVSEDASFQGHQAPLIEQAHGWYTSLHPWIARLTRLRVVPMHILKLFERLSQGGDAFIEADKKLILTTSWYIVARRR